MKTACEEAAAILCDDFIPARHYADDKRALQEREALAKRLRAEGRELKRLRGLIFGAFGAGRSVESIYKSTSRLHDEAARIQKARKK